MLLVVSAAFAVVAGSAVYLLDRSWGSVPFLAPFEAWQTDRLGLFGALGYSLPSFLHAYAFALLLILALMPSRAARWLGPLAWLVVAATVFTVYFGLIQFRAFPHSIALVRGDYSDPNDAGEVSHFQALARHLSRWFRTVAARIRRPGTMVSTSRRYPCQSL